MAPFHTHLLTGALYGTLPDLLLLSFGWRRRWLPESHPLVRAHRFLHGPGGLVLVAILAYASHLIIDRRSTHREVPTV